MLALKESTMSTLLEDDIKCWTAKGKAEVVLDITLGLGGLVHAVATSRRLGIMGNQHPIHRVKFYRQLA